MHFINLYKIKTELGINNQLDANLKENLTQLSNLCAYEYGTPVYKSRALLNQHEANHRISYDDSQLCSQHLAERELLNIENKINLFPNPASSILHIQNNTPDNILNISIFDASGRLINNLLTLDDDKNYYFDVSNMYPGLYLIYFDFDDGSSLTKKFVVN